MKKYRFYHACPNEDLESILKEGLLRSKCSLWKASGGAVYLTREPVWMNESQEHTVLKIDLTEEFVENTEIWGWEDFLAKNERWQFICWKDIPPKFIKINI